MPGPSPPFDPDTGPGEGGLESPGAKFVPDPISQEPIALCVANGCGQIGDPDKGGNPGTGIIDETNPGDLGRRYLDVNSLLLYREFIRENATYNSLQPYNHRFRGHREGVKFNLVIQTVMTICSDLFQILKGPESNLKTAEYTTVYPTDAEVAYAQHIREQIRFKEWLLLKDIKEKWFE